MMIQCDNCTAWQHNDCMGVTEVEDGIPDHYLCEQCSPDEHKLFHELLRSGLKPEQIAAQRHEEAIQARRQKKGKRGKSGRQSAASSKPEPSEQVTPAQPTPQPPESNKRKHSMEASVIESGEFHLSQVRQTTDPVIVALPNCQCADLCPSLQKFASHQAMQLRARCPLEEVPNP